MDRGIYVENNDLNLELNSGITIKGALFIMFMVLAYGFLVSIPINIIFYIAKIVKPNVVYLENYKNILSSVLGYVLFVTKYNKDNNHKLLLNNTLKLKGYMFILLILFGYMLFYDNTLGILVSKFINDTWVSKIFEEMLHTPIAALISMVLVAPIFEEIIFRGIILDGLLKKYRAINAIVISGLMFGVFHFNLTQGINAFFIGIILGIIYFSTNSLIPCMFMHFANNFFCWITAYCPFIYSEKFSLTKLFIGIFISSLCMFIFLRNRKVIYD
ncbi:CPBP family intramembrane metalloprotease [Clostridium niameyense]|uniref:CPBP family intramembrane metalloprotease n=1 Tax=Clostridium niameyense TaxID=1622073 RepID=A0A6M0R8K1_9CLOT|nr:CPBP family intramembrane metalloprotease [Clostridium niameyense]